MGGVVVQRMIIEQVERSNDIFINSIRGIVYLAVPFAGSNTASIASKAYAIIPPIIGEYTISVQVRSLKIFSEELADQSGTQPAPEINHPNTYSVLNYLIIPFTYSIGFLIINFRSYLSNMM